MSQGAIVQADIDRLLLTDDPADVVAALAPIATRLSLKSPEVSRMTAPTQV